MAKKVSKKVGRDPNMDTAYKWGMWIRNQNRPGVPEFDLPFEKMKSDESVAVAMHEIDGIVTGGKLLKEQTHIEFFDNMTKAVFRLRFPCQILTSSEAADPQITVSKLLRMWAGCIIGAKTIALKTRSGPNTPKIRARNTKKVAKYMDDPMFRQGLRAAYAFKKLRSEPVSFIGIPKESWSWFGWPKGCGVCSQ